jgi:hypothetical protein
MPDERIRRARRAELKAAIEEQGTKNERWELTFSGMRRAEVTLTQLAEAAERDESLGPLPAEPKVLARLARRVERRRRLGLPKKDCAARRVVESCDCLGATLDEIDENAGKREVLAAARKLHRARHPRFKPVPTPPKAEREAARPKPKPPPRREPVTETPTKPARVVKHFPRWFDPPTRSILDRKF